jgi:phosphoglycerate dehydrogenase-like enzyme
MQIAIFDERVGPEAASRFAGHDLRVSSYLVPSADDFVELARDATAIGVRRIPGWSCNRSVVERLPNLQFIHKSGTGLDWFDLDALNEHGVLLATNDGANATAVADHIVLVTLLCFRDLVTKINQMRNGIWDRDPPPGGAIPLEGATIGIVGLGTIGTHAARRFAASGAKIVANGRHPREVEGIPGGVRWLSLPELLREADAVVLTVPLTPETRHLIDAAELAQMKPSGVLVNVARGPIVDVPALYQALASGQIRAASVDVYETEPPDLDHPLYKLDNFIATPHIAGYATNQIVGLLDNLERFVQGRRPLHLANPEILDRGTARAGLLSDAAKVG